MSQRQNTFYRRFGKRIVDLGLAIPALIVVAPVMAVVAIVIRSSLGKPVLFRQVRPGLNAQPFQVLKFRTMTEGIGADGHLKPDAERLTSFGRFLRRTSLDELPQLLNVCRGELSIIGPRPLLMEYLPLYTAEQAKRHLVPPGITGWAQVNGRAALSWEEKFKLDGWYAEHQSFGLDLRILLMTIVKVLQRKDTEGAGNVKFTGSGECRKSEEP